MQRDVFNPGDMAGEYEIQQLIGAGGHAEVYLAVDAQEKPVAIKVLRESFRGSPMVRRRFLNESRVLAVIDDIHVVRFLKFGVTPAGVPWMAMEYVEGKSLREYLHDAGGRLGIDKALRFARQIAQGTGVAHDSQIFHRDLKPENVLITAGDIAKVVDFGIAKLRGWGNKTTQRNELWGTPLYMAPEQFDGEPVDARTDVFALGVMLYEMLSGRNPFVGPQGEVPSPDRLRELHRGARSIRELVAGVDEYVEAVVTRAMAWRPEDRYASMTALGVAVGAAHKRWRDEHRPSALPPAGGGTPVLAQEELAAFGKAEAPALAELREQAREEALAEARAEALAEARAEALAEAPEGVPGEGWAEPARPSARRSVISEAVGERGPVLVAMAGAPFVPSRVTQPLAPAARAPTAPASPSAVPGPSAVPASPSAVPASPSAVPARSWPELPPSGERARRPAWGSTVPLAESWGPQAPLPAAWTASPPEAPAAAGDDMAAASEVPVDPASEVPVDPASEAPIERLSGPPPASAPVLAPSGPLVVMPTLASTREDIEVTATPPPAPVAASVHHDPVVRMAAWVVMGAVFFWSFLGLLFLFSWRPSLGGQAPAQGTGASVAAVPQQPQATPPSVVPSVRTTAPAPAATYPAGDAGAGRTAPAAAPGERK